MEGDAGPLPWAAGGEQSGSTAGLWPWCFPPGLWLWLLLPAVENQHRCPQAKGKERQHKVSTAVVPQSRLPDPVNPQGLNSSSFPLLSNQHELSTICTEPTVGHRMPVHASSATRLLEHSRAAYSSAVDQLSPHLDILCFHLEKHFGWHMHAHLAVTFTRLPCSQAQT